MEMKLDSTFVKTQRKQRAWSQEHLASVAGLGLRTVQRIEKTGAASYESAQAIAAAFEINVKDLAPVQSDDVPVLRVGLRTTLLSAAAAVLVVLLLVSRASWAEHILLDVGISQNGAPMVTGQLLTAAGKDAQMRIDDSVRVVISPTVHSDGKVLLLAKIYEQRAGEFVLLAQPKLLTANKKQAQIVVTGFTGNEFNVLITPYRSD